MGGPSVKSPKSYGTALRAEKESLDRGGRKAARIGGGIQQREKHKMLEIHPAAGTSGHDGVFIPYNALPGVQESELADSEAVAVRESKVYKAVLVALHNGISESEPLGLQSALEVPSGTAEQSITQSYSLTVQRLVFADADYTALIPPATAGANSGAGLITMNDVFPGAVKVAQGAALSMAGVVIRTSVVAERTTLTQATIGSELGDDRDWLAALMLALGRLQARTVTIPSAVTVSQLGNYSTSALSAEQTAATDPTTGVAGTDALHRLLLTRTATVTVELLLDQSSQSFDVNVVTA